MMINYDRPPPVKVGACRALSHLLPDTNKEILRPHFLDIFSSLTDLLKHVSNYGSIRPPYFFFSLWLLKLRLTVCSPGFWWDHASSAWNTPGGCKSRLEEYKLSKKLNLACSSTLEFQSFRVGYLLTFSKRSVFEVSNVFYLCRPWFGGVYWASSLSHYPQYVGFKCCWSFCQHWCSWGSGGSNWNAILWSPKFNLAMLYGLLQEIELKCYCMLDTVYRWRLLWARWIFCDRLNC